jgi:organic hydroperoxide reductase OsmC/OhrA
MLSNSPIIKEASCHLFEVQLNWVSKDMGVASSKDVIEGIRIATSCKFGGQGRVWSAEYLLLASVSSSFMSIFLAEAHRNRLEVQGYDSVAIGHIKEKNGYYELSQIDVYPEIRIHENALNEKLNQALQHAQEHCVVARSLKIKVLYHHRIVHKGLFKHVQN